MGAESETLVETGVPIATASIFCIERQPPNFGGIRMRVFSVSRPRDDTAPKSAPETDWFQPGWASYTKSH